ncbi:MAG TPA: hydrogenase expression/formation protein HypE [Phycisphaerae bacterium]|nr:hydrogenase expression/formation protein HypE [Phycisphaerae bacterium]
MSSLMMQTERVMLAHGGGGELMQRLIREHVLPNLQSGGATVMKRVVSASSSRRSVSDGTLTDSAIVPWHGADVVFTTDSYVVTPIEFPGGDIGRLAVCGTVNDLAVMGAEPIAISLGLILEEGLPLETLDRVMRSIGIAAHEAGVEIVTGDTKVIERRSDEPELMINTAGVGRLRADANLSIARVTPGDCVLINGPIAEHGLAITSVRSGLEFDTPLRTDAAPLNSLIVHLLDSGADVKFLRDATRGGLAGVLADISEESGLSIEIDESKVPISSTARQAAEMLGLDPLTVANEGKVVCVVSQSDCAKALTQMRAHGLGWHATCIGVMTEDRPPLVELVTRLGGRRIVQRPYGEELPRIC